jgi:hypothetical protein
MQTRIYAIGTATSTYFEPLAPVYMISRRATVQRQTLTCQQPECLQTNSMWSLPNLSGSQRSWQIVLRR